MNTQNVDYNTLTAEQIEEYVEFIDWSFVPFHLLTDNVKKLFGSIPRLVARIWLEDLLSQMVVKEDQEKFPDRIFFFIGDECLMNLELKNWSLWCSHDAIWSILEKKIGTEYSKVQSFIKNVMEQHFKNEEVTPGFMAPIVQKSMEQHFKDKEVTPKLQNLEVSKFIEQHFKTKPSIFVNDILNKTEVHIIEKHFKNKQITPDCDLIDKTSFNILAEGHFKKR